MDLSVIKSIIQNIESENCNGVDDLDFTKLNIHEIRELVQIVNINMAKYKKGTPAFNLYTTMKYELIKEERERPIEEQFPFICGDVVSLLESTRRLEESTRRLDNSENNRSKANELAIRNCLQRNLGNEYNDIAEIFLEEGKIKKNKDTTIVQWDSIFYGTKNDVNTIFFVEVKEIPHPNDILYQSSEPKRKLDFNDKIEKTNEFFTEILPQDDSKRGNQFKTQNNTLRPFLSSPRVYIYASGKMHLDIIKRFELLTKPAENVHIAYAECDHYSQCKYTTIN